MGWLWSTLNRKFEKTWLDLQIFKWLNSIQNVGIPYIYQNSHSQWLHPQGSRINSIPYRKVVDRDRDRWMWRKDTSITANYSCSTNFRTIVVFLFNAHSNTDRAIKIMSLILLCLVLRVNEYCIHVISIMNKNMHFSEYCKSVRFCYRPYFVSDTRV